MGYLLEGQWKTDWYEPDEEGRFKRPPTRFRGAIEHGGAHPPDEGRYHLYVSYACPWAHRTLIVRALKGLNNVIDVSVVHPLMDNDGWTFEETEGTRGDTLFGKKLLREIYVKADPNYTGRVTVPVLWDTASATIVNNESREIIRMLGTQFNDFATRSIDLAPVALLSKIEEVITAIYEPINNGVYRAGFATSQGAYEEAVKDVFAALEHWEDVLSKRRWLCGDQFTEADICMFTTLVRFDSVYHYHFKCNIKRLQDFPSLWAYVREIYQHPRITPTVNMVHIKRHYFESHPMINPTRIVPVGPQPNFMASHGRESLGGQAIA